MLFLLLITPALWFFSYWYILFSFFFVLFASIFSFIHQQTASGYSLDSFGPAFKWVHSISFMSCLYVTAVNLSFLHLTLSVKHTLSFMKRQLFATFLTAFNTKETIFPFLQHKLCLLSLFFLFFLSLHIILCCFFSLYISCLYHRREFWICKDLPKILKICPISKIISNLPRIFKFKDQPEFLKKTYISVQKISKISGPPQTFSDLQISPNFFKSILFRRSN